MTDNDILTIDPTAPYCGTIRLGVMYYRSATLHNSAVVAALF